MEIDYFDDELNFSWFSPNGLVLTPEVFLFLVLTLSRSRCWLLGYVSFIFPFFYFCVASSFWFCLSSIGPSLSLPLVMSWTCRVHFFGFHFIVGVTLGSLRVFYFYFFYIQFSWLGETWFPKLGVLQPYKDVYWEIPLTPQKFPKIVNFVKPCKFGKHLGNLL